MNQYIRYTIAVLFAIIGGAICFWTNTQLGENIIFNGIETLVSASILGDTFTSSSIQKKMRKKQCY